MNQCPNEFGIYNSMIKLKYPAHMLAENGGYYYKKDSCSVDQCIVDEIQMLWSEGIHTMGCCCGHGIIDASVIVLNYEDEEKLHKLGYVYLNESKKEFKLKSKHNKYC